MTTNFKQPTGCNALLTLGFPPAPGLPSLNLARSHNSQAHSTKGTPSQELLPALTCCGFTVSGSLSLPSPGFFSPFPHGTSSLSVVTEYLAFDRGRPGFRQDFSCLAVLRYRPTESSSCRVRGFHPLCQAFPKPFRYNEVFSKLRPSRADGPTTPPLQAV